MRIIINENSYFIFDLDDTLFYEIDYLKSAYRHIAKKLETLTGVDYYNEMLALYNKGENVFEWILKEAGDKPFVNKDWLLKEYREHQPEIVLNEGAKHFLQQLKARNILCGLITDGRSISQRNKLKALGIENYFTDIIISEEFGSEKPDERNYIYFKQKHPGKVFYFFGDNTSKDFIAPLKLGWQCFCIKNNGAHIHQQTFDMLNKQCHIISSFNEIELL